MTSPRVESQPLAFISYSHEDNRNSQGGVKSLVDALQAEYDLISGETLRVFIDDSSIEWGQEWRARIDGALTQTTFFIPIITPRYFKREECRREFVEFSSQAESLGLDALILPILYVEVAGLASDSRDEIVARVARLQRADWRQLWLANPSSSEYRNAVNLLAGRLYEASLQVSESQIAQELDLSDGESELLGIADILEKMDGLMPAWLEAVVSNRTTRAQMAAIMVQSIARVQRLRRGGSPRSAIMSTQLRLGTALLPLEEEAKSEVYSYLKLSLQLDPWMIAAGRELRRHPEGWPLFRSVYNDILEAIDAIKEMEENARHIDEGGIGSHSIFDHVLETEHLSRTLGRVCALDNENARIMESGHEIVNRWWQDLSPVAAE